MIQKKKIPITFSLIIIGIALLIAIFWNQINFRFQRAQADIYKDSKIILNQSDAKETLPVRANCSYPVDASIEFDGTVRLPLEISKNLDLEKNPIRAVERQLLYLSGYFNFSDNIKRSDKGFSKFLLRPGQNISITSIRRINYGDNLVIDPAAMDDQGLYPAAWQSRIVQIKTTTPAIEIKYHVTREVTVCRESEKVSSSKVSVKLPIDPYLAFWYVPRDQRRKLKFNSSELVTNPCADAQMAELRQPAMYWYAFNPTAEGKDLDGVIFNCRNILDLKKKISTVEVKLRTISMQTEDTNFDLLLRNQKINLQIIFGFAGYSPKEHLRVAKKALLAEKDLTNFPRKVLNEKSYLENKDWDLGFWGMLDVIESLKQVIDLESLVAKDSGSYITIEGDGSLKKSQKPVHLKFFLGSTDQHQQQAQHWNFLADAFKSADLIFYIGHAGLGKNMDLNLMRKELNLPAEEWNKLFQPKDYQLLGILSCYANGYYGLDYAHERKPSQVSDLITTASGKYLPYVPTGFLLYLDLVASGSDPSLKRALEMTIPSSEVLTYDRY